MYLITISVVLTLNFILSGGSDIFHKKSRTTFYPDSPSSYFGYSVVLSNTSLIVGAPKATSRVMDSIAPGQVFSCRLTDLFTRNAEKQNVTCYPLGMDSEHDKSIRRIVNVKDFFRNDMWFGATVATVPSGKLIVCAPRWADPYKDKHLLVNGACYVETKRRGITLTALKDNYRLAYLTDGARKEYGEYGTHLNFYAYGQAGMSIKVTENNSIIIGAPGLMQWTGGIIDYRFSTDPNSVYFYKKPIANPYFTKELGPDDYFGYSVESGIFELNGSTLYVAGAPRSKLGFGQVLVFEPPLQENDPLNVRAKVRGPQLGSYFGASLCCTDLNGDGRTDLLVGAPNFVTKKEEMPYDQGAVFIYLASGETSNIVLEEASYVSGSGESGARFGSTIAALGDVDGDGYNDIAVGAPWENDGLGAVYIYRGSSKGLENQYVQRIIAEDARGFGMSISKGLDVDGNNCSDLAVGAHDSATAYIYRCIPTIDVHASIKVPDAMNLPKNITSFSAVFCIHVAPSKSWAQVKIDLKANITIDPESNRAFTAGDSEIKFTARPGNSMCDEQTIEVKPTADLSKPILMMMDLQPMEPLIDDSPMFHKDAARLSENSTLHTSFLIQLIRDCGEDLICTPLLTLSLEAIDSEYVPGLTNHLGVEVNVTNHEEPAYGAQVILQLPLPPKRVPAFCALKEMIMTCDVTSPLQRGATHEFKIELEDTSKIVEEKVLTVKAELKHPLYIRNENEKAVQDVNITVVPKADFKISGKTLPNNTITVSREKYYEVENVTFIHYFEITNLGPSDWALLKAKFSLPENVTLSNLVKGCEVADSNVSCGWTVPAATSISVALSLKYDLSQYGSFFEDLTKFNATTRVLLETAKKENLSITTTLILDPAIPIWPYILAIAASTIIGLLLLGGIVYGLHKYGFFSRSKREELKRRQQEEERSQEDVAGCSTSPPSEADESTQELLSDSD